MKDHDFTENNSPGHNSNAVNNATHAGHSHDDSHTENPTHPAGEHHEDSDSITKEHDMNNIKNAIAIALLGAFLTMATTFTFTSNANAAEFDRQFTNAKITNFDKFDSAESFGSFNFTKKFQAKQNFAVIKTFDNFSNFRPTFASAKYFGSFKTSAFSANGTFSNFKTNTARIERNFDFDLNFSTSSIGSFRSFMRTNESFV